MRRVGLFFYIFFVVILLGVGIGMLTKSKESFQISLPSFITVLSTTKIPYPVPLTSDEIATVGGVIDGDTITLLDKRKVRYIGIDTPETRHPIKGVECFGKEASAKNKSLILGKTIRMKKDVSDVDRYGRLLRYVWIDATESAKMLFVNEYLVREGYASASTFPPDVAYALLFKKSAEDARSNKKGLWGLCK
ncbi:MAG: thermonuclease family protein [Microgenomates group bacterium]